MAVSAILLVDDEQDSCISLSDVISHLDHEAAAAHDGSAARELSWRCVFGPGFLDDRLPGVQVLAETCLRRAPSVAVKSISCECQEGKRVMRGRLPSDNLGQVGGPRVA